MSSRARERSERGIEEGTRLLISILSTVLSNSTRQYQRPPSRNRPTFPSPRPHHAWARLVPVVGGRGGGGSSYSLPGSLTRPSPHPPLSLSFSPSSKRVSVSCEGVTHPQKTLRVLSGCKPRMNSNYHPRSEIILPRNSMRNGILCLLFLTIICVSKAKLNFDIFPRM